MKENINQIIREMQSCKCEGPELEEQEFLLLQELCVTEDTGDVKDIFQALGALGTISAIPALLGHLHAADDNAKPLLTTAVDMIKTRARNRGSFLPDVFFKIEHWKPSWSGSKNTFLSYVEFIGEAYVKCGHDEGEVNRIGGILAEEMDIDISPYQTFADFKLCQTSWDFKADYKLIQERIAEEKVMEDLATVGVGESDISLLTGTLMDLQYDYLIARLNLKGKLEYYRFLLEIAECLNKPE